MAPESRRERPAKAPLSREGIISAALAILENEGLGKVTMRRIAAALDTGPASLYVYVRDTEDLHAQLLDALLDGMAPTPAAGSWRERLRALLTAYGRVLFEHPEIARMTMTTHPTGPRYAALLDSVLELLGEGGIDDDTAAWAVDLLLASVTATAVEHAGRSEEDDDATLAVLAAELARTPADRYPNLARVGDRLVSGLGPERFQWALDVLITGVVGTPRIGKGQNS